jgi:hypothetical protein
MSTVKRQINGSLKSFGPKPEKIKNNGRNIDDIDLQIPKEPTEKH